MQAIKYVAFILGGLFALIVAVAIFVAATFDANRLKSQLTTLVKEKKERTLTIDGELSLSFWPSLGVKMGKASLSEHDSEQIFAALDSGRLSVRVIPLLSKRIVVDTVELSGARATLVRHQDGTTNIDDLLSAEPQQQEAVRFDIAGVKIDHGQLGYRDEKTGQSAIVSNLDLSTGRIANAADGKVKLSADIASEKPRSAAQVKVDGEYRYALDKKIYALARLDGKATGDIAGMKAIDVALAAGALQLQGARGEMMVDGLSLSAKGRHGNDSFDVKVSAPKLALTRDSASGEAVTVVARLAGAARTMAARLDLSGISGSAEALRIAKFALQLDAKSGDTSVAGALSSPLAANLSAQTMELPRIAGEFDVAHPRMPMKSVKLAVSGRLKADLGKQTAAAEAATRFDDSRIQARLDVSKFSPLALGFDLDVDKLNVDRYLPPKQAPAGARKTEEPMDFSALKGLDAHGTVKIGALQFANVKAANVRLQTRAAGGRLEVAPHSATLYGGSLSGALSINANDNTLAARESLSNVSINPLMKDALDKDLIEGRGNVSLDVATAGNTMTAMKKALAGSARVNLHDGAVKGINLAKALREAKAALSMKQDTVQQASRSEKTDFSELAASFRIARGIAHNDDLMLKSPFLRVGGAGDINVAEGRMNYLAKASVVATAGGQGGKELEHLKGLTVPVRISGPFDNLSYRLELANLAQEAVRAKVEEKKQEVKEKAQEQIREGIKGLFKR